MFALIEAGKIVDCRDTPTADGDWRPLTMENRRPFDPLTEIERMDLVIEPSAARQIYRFEPRDMAHIRAHYHRLVDDDAEACRLRFVTPGDGMAMTYAEKRDQAIAVNDLGENAANAMSEEDRVAQFPTLAASVGTEAPTLWECAQLVIAKAEAWASISYAIETKRLAGKKSISDASDAAAALAAYEAIKWNIP